MGEGLRSALPAARVAAIPLADGGDGTLDVLADRLQASVETVRVTGPAGSPTDARLALTEDEAIIIYDAAGNRLLEPGQRDPFETSTFGVGELIRQRSTAGSGASSSRWGAPERSMSAPEPSQALGVRFRDDRGSDLAPTPRGLAGVRSVDVGGLDARLARTELVVLADVDSRCATAPGSTARRRGLTRNVDRSWRARWSRWPRRRSARSTCRTTCCALPCSAPVGPAGRTRRLSRRERRRWGGLRRAPLAGRLARGTRGGRRPAHRRGPAGFDLLPRQGTRLRGRCRPLARIRSCAFTGQVAAGADQHLPATSDCVVLGTDPGRPRRDP